MEQRTCQRYCLKRALLDSAARGRESASNNRQNARNVPSTSTAYDRYLNGALELETSAARLQAAANGIRTQDEGGLCHGQGLCGSVVQF